MIDLKVRAVYPGTFDPLTSGHEDLCRRASKLYGEVVIGVADSRSKRPLFTLDERMQIAREALALGAAKLPIKTRVVIRQA